MTELKHHIVEEKTIGREFHVPIAPRRPHLMAKTYTCENPACSLGAVGESGRFSGGATKDFVTLLTGDPDPDSKNYGHGVCPNCGKPGKETKD